jgi:hypothetical protein
MIKLNISLGKLIGTIKIFLLKVKQYALIVLIRIIVQNVIL